MAPTTRSSTKKSAHKDERDIISWTSAVTGETLIYEKFHTYEDEGEVLYVQLRVTEDGVLVPWTKDTEDENKGAEFKDGDLSEKGEADTDFVPEAANAQRRQTVKVNNIKLLPAASSPALFIPASSSAPAANLVEEMTELEEHELILDLAVNPLSEAVLLFTSQSSLSSLLSNFRLADLSDVNGARAHAMEKEAYDAVRPGKTINGRWVLDPRATIFRPTNPDYKAIAEMGP